MTSDTSAKFSMAFSSMVPLLLYMSAELSSTVSTKSSTSGALSL